MFVDHITKPKWTLHPFKPIPFRIGKSLHCRHPKSYTNDALLFNAKQTENVNYVSLAYIAWKMLHTTMGKYKIGEKGRHLFFPHPTLTIWQNCGQFDTCPTIGSSTIWHFGYPLCTCHWRNAYPSWIHSATSLQTDYVMATDLPSLPLRQLVSTNLVMRSHEATSPCSSTLLSRVVIQKESFGPSPQTWRVMTTIGLDSFAVTCLFWKDRTPFCIIDYTH